MNTQKEIFNAKLESIKAQLEDLTKEFEANYKREKPVIEVGKVYTPLNEYEGIAFVMITGFDKHNDLIEGYGISYKGEFVKEWNGFYNTERREATKEEWEQALTKYFDKLYEGVDKVDRTGFCKNEWYKNDIVTLNGQISRFDSDGFVYKGRYVMDKNGNIAKPVESKKEEVKENYFEYFGVGQYKLCLEGEPLTDGKYKLVKVN